MPARIVAFLLLALVPLPSRSESDFWLEVRQPGITAFRRAFAEGVVLARQERFAEALNAFGRAVRARPDEPLAHRWRGDILYRLERWAEAVEAWDQARGMDSRMLDEPRRGFDLAVALSRVGDAQRGVIEYERIIRRLGPAESGTFAAVVHANCAELLMALGPDRLDLAVRHYRSSLEQQPDYRPAHWGLAVALDRQGDSLGAVREARWALAGDEGLSALSSNGTFFVPAHEAHTYRALGLEVLGRRAEALSEWRAFLDEGGRSGPWRDHAERHLASPLPGSGSPRTAGRRR